jgi:homoserine kinase type II
MTTLAPPGREDIVTLLTQYDVRPIEALASQDVGPCYSIASPAGRFSLGLVRTDTRDLVALTSFLTTEGIPCAPYAKAPDSTESRTLNGWHALLAGPLSNDTVRTPTLAQCSAIGEMLARLHTAGSGFLLKRENERGPRWWRETAAALSAQLDVTERTLLQEELRFQSLYRFADLPRGVVHGALGPAHARFEGDHVREIDGFHHACTDMWLLDIAQAVHDWCSEAHALDTARALALLEAYHARRPLRAIERGAWPILLRSVALERWLCALVAERSMPAVSVADAKTALLDRIERADGARGLWPAATAQRRHA